MIFPKLIFHFDISALIFIFLTADIVWLFLLSTFCVYEIKGHKHIPTLLLELELLRICISELLQD